ncbi:MAG: transposase [Candidatus Nomurabacteria bacterium]|nr:transposase [Candidatus Nomurabacteria bacterium]
MSIRKVDFEIGEFYHIYNRGNSKQKIFNNKEDYERFIKLLFLSNGSNSFKIHFIKNDVVYDFDRGERLVDIGAYCLMPNHFHFLIKEKAEDGISKFMQKLTTAYVMYYNEKHKRTGSLFEGKFKSEHVGNNIYLKYIFSYIHLNPIKLLESKWKEVGIKDKNRAIDFLKNYRYSTFRDYLDKNRIESTILNKKAFPNYFPNSRTFIEEILDWINYNKNELN